MTSAQFYSEDNFHLQHLLEKYKKEQREETQEDDKEERRVKEHTPTITQFIPSLNQITTDVDKFNKRVFFTGQQRGLRCIILGTVEPNSDPVILLTPKRFLEGRPRILVIGGMHGNEPCGPYAILKALETISDETLFSCNISFIPCINPYGLRMGDRTDNDRDDPNRGYIHKDKIEQKDTTQSGDVLMNNKNLLLNLGRDCFVSLHEDWEEESFYCYVSEQDGDKELGDEIIEVAKMHFDIKEGGKVGSAKVSGGKLDSSHDGSFEDFMYDNASKICVTIETPGMKPIDERILCAIDCIEKIIEYTCEEK